MDYTANIIQLVFIISVVASLDLSQQSKARKYGYTEGQLKIIGGINASIKHFPYQVALYTKTINDEVLNCGGSIISNHFILTAAHCFIPYTLFDIVVRAGSSRLYSGTILQVNKKDLIPHPDFNSETLDKDIGLIRTEKQIVFTDAIQPIKLPKKGMEVKDGTIFTVSGWGRTGAHKPGSHDLLAVQLPVVNKESCRNKYDEGPMSITENMWCAGGFPSGGKAVCHGDFGGPAVQDGVQIGIVSWGNTPCASPNYPDVFTYVAAPAIRDFIQKYTGL